MRILFCSTGGAGHLQPMRPLARALQARGHRVAWFTAPDALAPLQGQGLDLFEGGLTFRASRGAFRAAHPEAVTLQGEALAAHTFPRLFAGILAPAMLPGLGRCIDHWRPDLVVHEPAALAAPLACSIRGVRSVTHGYGLRLPPEHLSAAMALFGPHWEAAGLPIPPDGGLHRGLSIEIVPESLQPASSPDARSVLRFNPYRPGGVAPGPWPPSLQAALGASRQPCLYLSFGTVFNGSPALAQAAAGLARTGCTVVVTLGADGDRALLGDLPPNVHVHGHVDQAGLLPHCSAVVSHGGAGTMLGAAAQGLPQLLLPQAADHFRNARALLAVGAGLVIEPGELSAHAVHRATVELLASTAHRLAAQRLAREMGAMGGADEVAAALVLRRPT